MSIGGQRYYLWRAVDQDGDVIDIPLQKRCKGWAAKRFFGKLLKSQQAVLNGIVTDKLGSYRVAHKNWSRPYRTTQTNTPTIYARRLIAPHLKRSAR
ncbi:MAG: transposase-like protein [Gammaproteobacteria bacterium]|jgi:transposase-like protein